MDINKELRDKAVSLGLCSQWKSDWEDNKSLQELINMYKKGVDFCFENNYPTNEFMTTYIEPPLLDGNNIFIDCEFNKKNPENDCIVLGDSKGELKFDKFAVRDIYIKDAAELNVIAEGFAKIFVNVYGNAKVKVSESECAKVKVFYH